MLPGMVLGWTLYSAPYQSTFWIDYLLRGSAGYFIWMHKILSFVFCS